MQFDPSNKTVTYDNATSTLVWNLGIAASEEVRLTVRFMVESPEEKELTGFE